MASSDRKGGGLSVRTLAIASLASAAAATVVSRVFPPGTVYASAFTPVIVAAVSELLNRPVDRVTSLREQRRTLIRQQRATETSRVLGEEPNPLRGAPSFAQGAEGFDDEPTAGNGHRTGGDPLEGVRIHGRRRRVLHPKVWIATGLIAFAVAVAALTLPELIFGGAISSHHGTTLFGGGSAKSKSKNKNQQNTTSTQPQQSKPKNGQTTPATPAPSSGTTSPSQTTPQSTAPQKSPQQTTPQQTSPIPTTPAPGAP